MEVRGAVYAGSFDPPTNGHLWTIREASRLFDEVTVVVATNPEKKSLFDANTRVQMLREMVTDSPDVTVGAVSSEYIVNFAERIGAKWLVRGIRNASDYEYERMIRHLNTDINDTISTVLLQPPRELAEVSSSVVKGLIGPDGWERIVARYVPQAVLIRLIGRHHNWLWEELAKAGARDTEDDFWNRTLVPYFAEGRMHHNACHISEVLTEIVRVRGQIKDLAAVGFAAVCHDIVMDSFRSDNEARSADFAESYGDELGLPWELPQKAARMVLSTINHLSDDPDEQCLIGADTAVLGYSKKRFDEYERGVAHEYSARYTPKEFAVGRAGWITKFLAAHPEHIYAHPAFENRYGAQARSNLNRSLARITSQS